MKLNVAALPPAVRDSSLAETGKKVVALRTRFVSRRRKKRIKERVKLNVPEGGGEIEPSVLRIITLYR